MQWLLDRLAVHLCAHQHPQLTASACELADALTRFQTDWEGLRDDDED